MVAARQVVIGTSANAAASGNLIDTKTALNRAREDEKARLNEELTKLRAQLDQDNQAVVDATTSYGEAQKVTKDVKSNFDTASTSASAAAQGTGQFSEGGGNYRLTQLR